MQYTFDDKIEYHKKRVKTLELKSKDLKLTDKEKQDYSNSKGFLDGQDFTWFEYTSKSKIDTTYDDIERSKKMKKHFPKTPFSYEQGFENGRLGFRNELKKLGFEMFQDKKGVKK